MTWVHRKVHVCISPRARALELQRGPYRPRPSARIQIGSARGPHQPLRIFLRVSRPEPGCHSPGCPQIVTPDPLPVFWNLILEGVASKFRGEYWANAGGHGWRPRRRSASQIRSSRCRADLSPWSTSNCGGPRPGLRLGPDLHADRGDLKALFRPPVALADLSSKALRQAVRSGLPGQESPRRSWRSLRWGGSARGPGVKSGRSSWTSDP